jgi:hypothetical protein
MKSDTMPEKSPLWEHIEIQVQDYLDRFTLIIGEVNAGKTALSGRILEAYWKDLGGPITVVDLAPSFIPSDFEGKPLSGRVGGRLRVPEALIVSLFHGYIHPPRLRAKDEREAETLAEENARAVEAIFRQALNKESGALFINDCSLYLHAGNPRRLLRWIRTARTSVVNGYYGQSFGESPISRRERQGMAFLMEQCDQLIRL